VVVELQGQLLVQERELDSSECTVAMWEDGLAYFERTLGKVHKKHESASRPPSGFWCLNDKMIKELMTFAKCETGKMSYKLH
jgi:hypothetical protein